MHTQANEHPAVAEEVRRNLLESKPGVSDFIKRLKASHPAFMQPAQLAPRNPMPITTPARASAQHGPQPPLHPSGPPGSVQLPRDLPDVAKHQSSLTNTLPHHAMPHGSPWQQQHEARSMQNGMAHGPPRHLPYQHGVFPNGLTPSSGNRSGMPAPPPGFALVPIAPDGSLHYPGAITGPQQGGMGMSQAWGGSQGAWQQHPPPWSGSQQAAALGNPQLANQQWQQPRYFTQQQQQQQQQVHESGQQMRKRKHLDDVATNRGNGSIAGGSVGGPSGGSGNEGGGASMPDSNANAAAKLRDRLKAVTTAATATTATTATTAGCSSLQGPKAHQPQSGALNAQQAQHGGCKSEAEELRRSGVAQTVDPAELQISEEECRSSRSHAISDSEGVSQDPYQGPHGPDCIRVDDKTQVSPLWTKTARCAVCTRVTPVISQSLGRLVAGTAHVVG